MTDILQYLLGFGILGVLVTQILTSYRAWRERKRERDGLLRLLYTEVAQNKRNIAYVVDELNRAETAKSVLAMRGQYVRVEAWKAARVSLAQSVSSKNFAVLSDYYKNVLLIEEVVTLERGRKDRDPNHQASSDTIYKTKLLLQALQDLEGAVQALIRKQVPDVTASDRYAELAHQQALPTPPNSEQR